MARGLMTPEVAEQLVGITTRSIEKMKEQEHCNLQELRLLQKDGEVSEETFAVHKQAKLDNIAKIDLERRELLDSILVKAKTKEHEEQWQASGASQQMDAVLAALNGIDDRLAALEKR